MNDYTGKICPFCKTEFTLSDEVVICSECDMPHHKDCWIENQGCTTFGCKGTIKANDSMPSTVTQTHLKYDDAQFDNEPTYIGRSTNYGFEELDEEIQQMIGRNLEFYKPIFRMMKQQKKVVSWNWAAFLVSPFWFIYRKMYGYAAIALAANIFGVVSGFVFWLVYVLPLFVLSGIFGNILYLKRLEKNVLQAQATNEPYKSKFIATNSGVNVSITIIAVVYFALITLMHLEGAW